MKCSICGSEYRVWRYHGRSALCRTHWYQKWNKSRRVIKRLWMRNKRHPEGEMKTVLLKAEVKLVKGGNKLWKQLTKEQRQWLKVKR